MTGRLDRGCRLNSAGLSGTVCPTGEPCLSAAVTMSAAVTKGNLPALVLPGPNPVKLVEKQGINSLGTESPS